MFLGKLAAPYRRALDWRARTRRHDAACEGALSMTAWLPAPSILRAKPAVVNGASRSDVNTKGHLLMLNLRRLEHYTQPRPPYSLQLELADWFDVHGVLHFHQHSRTDEDLTRLGFVAKTRGDIRDRADGGIVEASFNPIVPSVAKPCAMPMPNTLPNRRQAALNRAYLRSGRYIQEISGSSRACNVCSADSNADTRGGKSRVPWPPGTPDSTVLAWPSCISWLATRPK